jgi:hypothetical protein
MTPFFSAPPLRLRLIDVTLCCLSILFFACSQKPEKVEETIQPEKKFKKPKIFCALRDSINIGEPGKNKIKIHQTRYAPDSAMAFFEFYKLTDEGWKFTQSHEMPATAISPLHTRIQDYDGDGKGDLSFITQMARRSANELRTLFIFRDGRLIEAKNSNKYPNLQYNQALHCLDSWMLHEGSTTAFLKLVHDSLVPFAAVNLMDTLLTVVENDRIIKQKRIEKKDLYMRYKNYKPLETIGEYKYSKGLIEKGLQVRAK